MRLSAQPENHPIESNEACDRGLGASVAQCASLYCALQALSARGERCRNARRPSLARRGCAIPLIKTTGNNGSRISGRLLRPLIVLGRCGE